jgi:RND family efflux transporter MFP subunit
VKKWPWIAGVVSVSLVAGAWLARARPSRPAPLGQEVARVVRRDLDSAVKATGVVRPMVGAEVRVGSRLSGVVERLLVRVGDRVAKGQLLAELETRELVARRDQAAAALQSARATRTFAELDSARARRLARDQAIAQLDLELAERGLALADAAVAQAEAALSLARIQLEQARIVAPIAGVVASVATQEGETVAASLAAPTFLTIVGLDRLELWAYVDETDIGQIQVGQAALFGVDAYPGQSFEGQVVAVHPKAEIRDNVVDYVVVVRFAPPPDRTLRPDMTASVRVILSRRQGVPTLPRRAVRQEGGHPFVLCSESGRPVQRPVKTGARDEGRVEILEGLREGEEVLLGDPPTTAEQ